MATRQWTEAADPPKGLRVVDGGLSVCNLHRLQFHFAFAYVDVLAPIRLPAALDGEAILLSVTSSSTVFVAQAVTAN